MTGWAQPWRWSLSALALLFLLAGAWPGWAQPTPDVTSRIVGDTTNVFASLDLSTPTRSFRVVLPPRWTLDDISVLRYGATSVPLTLRTTSEAGTYRVRTTTPIHGPHEVVARVVPDRQPGYTEWSLVPLETTGPDAQKRLGDQRTYRIHLKRPPRADSNNRALSFGTAASAPLRLDSRAVPWSSTTSFSVEAWVQTIGRNEILLSSWTGNERDPYLLDVVVAPSGRVRSYFGRPGNHRSLVSSQPIADGQWHHVAVTYEADRRHLRLLLDGMVVDSLQNVSLPAVEQRPPLVVGGRPGADPKDKRPLRFSGTMDDVRVWGEARTPTDIRRTMRQTMQSRPGQRLSLSFDAEAPPDGTVRAWPRGMQRIPSTRPRRPVLSSLQAVVEEGVVRLHWTAPSPPSDAFVIERSPNGSQFRPIGRVPPAAPSSATTQDYSFTDPTASDEVVFYRIRYTTRTGQTRRSGTLKVGRGAPASPESRSGARLLGNFPNPFSNATTITYKVHEAIPLTLTVWNVTGNRIAQIVDRTVAPGYYEHVFSAQELPSGTYFLRMETPSGIQSHQMVLLK